VTLINMAWCQNKDQRPDFTGIVLSLLSHGQVGTRVAVAESSASGPKKICVTAVPGNCGCCKCPRASAGLQCFEAGERTARRGLQAARFGNSAMCCIRKCVCLVAPK
jgi:hypothetical protein